MTNEEPTKTQKEVYNALLDYMDEHGFPPSAQDLADQLGKADTAILQSFERLDDQGYVEREEGINRSTIPVGFKQKLTSICENLKL